MTVGYVAVPCSPPNHPQDAAWRDVDGKEDASVPNRGSPRQNRRQGRHRWALYAALMVVAGAGIACRPWGTNSTADDLIFFPTESDGLSTPPPANLPDTGESGEWFDSATNADDTESTVHPHIDVVDDTNIPTAPTADEDVLPDDLVPTLVFTASTVSELDRQVCGHSPCSFLVAGRTNEQETKAQQHLGQLAVLAQKLNRTLVLPNVEGGSSFDYYHDLESFNAFFDMEALLWKDFVAYTKRREELGRTLNAHYIVHAHQRDTEHKEHTAEKAPLSYSLNKICADRAALDFTAYHNVRLAPGKNRVITEAQRMRYGQWLVDRLSDEAFYRKWATQSDSMHAPMPDVLFIYWEPSWFYLMTPGSTSLDTFISLPFHRRWQRLADRLADGLQPFVALHWRQEAFSHTIPDFVGCAKMAEEQVERLHAKSVYFMTDYPTEGGTHEHSDSYAKYLREHPNYRRAAKDGIDHLANHFTSSETQFTMLSKEDTRMRLADGSSEDVISLDDGLSGIIDKVADFFSSSR